VDHAARAIRATGRLSLVDRGLQPPLRPRPGNGGRLRGRGKTRPAPQIFAESAGSGAVAGFGSENVVWFQTIVKTAVRHTRTTPRRILLVMDSPDTHRLSTLYETFPPADASRLADRSGVHHTPKHGSWLNMAGTGTSVLSRRCLDRRIPDRETMVREVAA